MSKPKLVSIYDCSFTDDNGVSHTGDIAIDINTNEMYFNNQKVVTELQLDKTERRLLWAATISTIVMAICNILNIVLPFLK